VAETEDHLFAFEFETAGLLLAWIGIFMKPADNGAHRADL